MFLYLMRHASAFSQMQDVKRSLNTTGIKEANKIAHFVKEKKVRFSHIFHSSKTRAEQTANIIAKAVGFEDCEILSALEPDLDLEFLSTEIELLEDGTLLVGHLPNLELLCHELLKGAPGSETLTFPPAVMVCLRKEEIKGKTTWYLQWSVIPEAIK